MGCARRAAARRSRRSRHRARRLSPRRLGAPRGRVARDDDPLLDHRLRRRRAAQRSTQATTSTTSATRVRSTTPRPALPPVQIADLAAGAQAAVIEILAALLERARTGRGARLVVSMTHGSHRFVAHRLGEPVPRLLTGGVACYAIYETADGRYLTVAALEPKFWRNLCDLLDRPDLADRAFDARPARARGALPLALAAGLARPARGQGHLRGPRPHARRSRGPTRMSTLAALAFALAGIHVGADRMMPVGYAPAWSPNGERIAFVTKGNLWVADADGTHRGELVPDADEPAWSPNGRRLAFTRKGQVYTVRVDGLDERVLAYRRAPCVVARWEPHRLRPRRPDHLGAVVRRRRAGRHRGRGSRLRAGRPARGSSGRRDRRRRADRRRGHLACLVAWRPARVRPQQRDLRRREGGARGPAAGLAATEARPRAAPRLRPASADRPDDRRRARPLAARLHVTRRQHRHRSGRRSSASGHRGRSG